MSCSPGFVPIESKHPNMYNFTAGGKTISVFPNTESGAPVIYLNTFSGEGQKISEVTQSAG